MYERFSEPARRAIYFADREARTNQSTYLESEHLLVGIWRENEKLFTRLGISDVQHLISACRNIAPAGLSQNQNSDIPVSNEVKRIFIKSVAEADDLSHQQIGLQHLLLGLLATQNRITEALKASALTYAAVHAFCSRGEQQ